MLVLNKNNFKSEVLESKIPVLVDFYSLGCAPCRTLEPILKVVDNRMNTDEIIIKFAKIEANEALDVFGDYAVERVPTMIIFKDGKDVDRRGGLMSEKDLTDWINSKAK